MEVCTLQEILFRVDLFWIKDIYYWDKEIHMNANKMKNYSKQQLFSYKTEHFIPKQVKPIKHMNKKPKSISFGQTLAI